MTWLTPILAIKAASITIPLLVLLYFLKLKRRPVTISSTLLWKRAVQDLQVNAPFQRLRKNILLLLQLLTLAAILALLGSPMIKWKSTAGERYVLLIDRSASMQATDVAPSRLDAAKELAREFLKTLNRDSYFGQGDEAMVIAFASEPQVICPFVSNQHELRKAIDSIQPVDGTTRLAEAVRIARAFATPTDPESMGRSAVNPAKLVLFSDGHIADSEKISLRKDEMTVYNVGKKHENIAITALQARRSFEDPQQVSVFVGLSNFHSEPAETVVQLFLNQTSAAVQHVKIPAVKMTPGKTTSEPGQTGVTFTLTCSDQAVLQVTQTPTTADVLHTDNSAWTILEPPQRLSVLLVGPGNLVLEEALRSLPLKRLDIMTPEQFAAVDPAKFELENSAQVVVLDRCSPKNFPRCGYLIFGPPPIMQGVSAKGPQEDQFLLDWRPNHPALRYINLENVYSQQWWNYSFPADAEILAESDHGPAIATLTRQGSSFLFVNFDILTSNWPFRPGFVMFLYNSIRLLGNPLADQNSGSLAANSILNLRLAPDTSEVQIIRPDGIITRRKPDSAGFLRYAPLDRTGIYRVELPDKKHKTFAVNLLDPVESDITPTDRIPFSGDTATVQKAGVFPANIELKPFLLLFAIMILSLEWFIYNKKVQI